MWKYEGGLTPKERPQPILAPFFTFLSSPPPQPHHPASPVQIGASQEAACLFRPRSSLRPWVFPSLPFCGLLPFSAFQRFTCALSSQAWHMVRLYDALHAYHGKRRRTEEPLDESERGEWKNQLKTLHSEN